MVVIYKEGSVDDGFLIAAFVSSKKQGFEEESNMKTLELEEFSSVLEQDFPFCR
ncbi:MAG: hypothetical protein H0W62_14710 [Chitinophagales bacterium]|nr:hypothetical protein [Chitinophagales bacterium]